MPIYLVRAILKAEGRHAGSRKRESMRSVSSFTRSSIASIIRAGVKTSPWSATRCFDLTRLMENAFGVKLVAVGTAAANARGKAQEEEAEGGTGVFLPLEAGICAKLVGGIPPALFKRCGGKVFFREGDPLHSDLPPRKRIPQSG